MVSSVLNMSSEELIATLARFRQEFADDAEYQTLRAAFPADLDAVAVETVESADSRDSSLPLGFFWLLRRGEFNCSLISVKDGRMSFRLADSTVLPSLIQELNRYR